MKTLTIGELFHSPTLVKALHPGQSLVVTADGKPNLIVTKAGARPRKSAEEFRREARRLLTKPGKKVDCAALLRRLRAWMPYVRRDPAAEGLPGLSEVGIQRLPTR